MTPHRPETRHGLPPEFFDAADRFVDIANELGAQQARDWVRATLMYAAARYAVFTHLTAEADTAAASPATAPDDDTALRYFVDQFDKMLRDNLAELTPIYAAARGAKGGDAG